MKLLLLCVTAASALTVYRNDDSMMMESQPSQTRHRGSVTYFDQIKNQNSDEEDYQSEFLTRHRHHSDDKKHHKNEEDDQKPDFTTRHKQYLEEKKRQNSDEEDYKPDFTTRHRQLVEEKKRQNNNDDDQSSEFTTRHRQHFEEKNRQNNNDDGQRSEFTTRHRHHFEEKNRQNSDDDHKSEFRVKHRQHRSERTKLKDHSSEESKKYHKKHQIENEEPAGPSYFEQIQSSDNNNLGYASFVQHHGDEASNGSMEINKLVPKSSVEVQMFLEPQTQSSQYKPQHTKQVLQKEASHAKLKNKPPKFYQGAISEYTKKNPSFQAYHSTTPSSVVIDLTGSTRYHNTAPTKYRTTSPSPPKRRPFPSNHHQENNMQSFQASEPYRQKERTPFTHTQANSASQNHHHVQSHSYSSFVDSKNPHWKPLSPTVEMASSDGYQINPKRTRKPKEISSSISSHAQYFDPEPERFKSERFDHEKAMKNSQPFSFTNAIFLEPTHNDDYDTVKPSPVHNVNHFYDNFKDVDTNKGPQTFRPTARTPIFPKTKFINAGGFQIPVMTEEEFEKNFGKIRPEYKIKPKRLAFDARALQKVVSSPKSSSPKEAYSFMQMNTAIPEWVEQTQNNPVFKTLYVQKPEEDNSSPYLSGSTRRNVSLIPERQARQYAEETKPQQFSVSASYQIERRNRYL